MKDLRNVTKAPRLQFNRQPEDPASPSKRRRRKTPGRIQGAAQAGSDRTPVFTGALAAPEAGRPGATESARPDSKKAKKRRQQRQYNAERRAEKAARKADRAEAKIPLKAKRQRFIDERTGEAKTRLQFRAKSPPKKLKFRTKPGVETRANQGLQRLNNAFLPEESRDEITSGAVRKAEGLSAVGVHGLRTAVHKTRWTVHTVERRPYRKAARAERRLEKRNRKALLRQAQVANPTSNPISRLMQRRQVKRAYAKQARAQSWGRGSQASGATPWRGSGQGFRALVSRKKRESAARAKHALKLLLPPAVLLVVILELFSACGMLISSVGGVVEVSAYAASEEDILAAEAAYLGMEAELQAKLDNYEVDHPEYDVYEYQLDAIQHDPYVLISMVSSLHPGAWTIDQVMPTLQDIFARQYTLTEEVTEEIVETPDPDPTEPTEPSQPPQPPRPPRPGEDQIQGSSTVRTVTVTLKNVNLPRLPVYLLSETQLEQYSIYMKSLGCRPDLFPESEYIGRYGTGTYLDFAIPTDALQDEVFAAMMAEARKYLGYPYVWGGSSPGTSFDCSGFVSWVINHTIVDGNAVWGNIGRRNVTGIHELCIDTSTPHPGDLVFFAGTYDEPGFTHIGIYVGIDEETGHRMMIHCGDPISFADLNNSYWQEHLVCYGRLP